MIKALSLDPSLNTPVETKRLEATRAAMANWKSYSHGCQARHNAHRLRLGHRSTGLRNNEPAASAHRRTDRSGFRFRRFPDRRQPRGHSRRRWCWDCTLRRPRRAGRLGFWACSWRSRSCASVKGRRGKPGPRPRRVGSYPIPRRPHYSLCPAPGRVARDIARGATIAAHGMTTPVRTNGDAPASARASAAIRRRTRRA
jgi:hypothetical protein